MSTSVTVVIGAHTEQRWPYLVRAVESALSQVPRPESVVVVVDHNDTLLHRVAAELPAVTAVANAFQRGASGTRNTGVQHARTPLVAFLDDDAAARPDWLSRLIEPFADPRVVGTGGGVAPVWQARRPGWFPEEFMWVVGASYLGMPTTRGPVRNVWSENMAVRREVFARVGGFRVGFGKVGNRSRPEDTDLCIRMAATTADARWVHIPQALVDHQVPPDRSTFGFYLRRCYHEGRGKIEMARLLDSPGTLGSERTYLRRTIPRGIARGVSDAVARRQFGGFARAGAIIAGLTTVGVGAVFGLTAPAPDRSRPATATPGTVTR